jgi:hypothetical protein
VPDADDAARDAAPDATESTDDGSIGQLVQLVKDYARQETLGPLRGASRWIGVGIAGSVIIAFGLAFLVLAVLRMFQYEFDSFDTRGWSLAPYGFALLLCVIAGALAAWRINKTTLQKGDKH